MRWRSRQNRLNATRRARYLPLSVFDRFKFWIVLALLGGSLSIGGWQFKHILNERHWFQVNQIIVEGQFRHSDPDHLLLLAGVSEGQSLLFLKLESLRERLEKHPWVKVVRLLRRFPHTLVVQVLEHEPIAIAATPEYYYVNEEGKLFKVVEKGESMDFPLLLLPKEAENSSLSGTRKKSLHEMIDFLKKYDQTRFSKEFGVSEVLWREGGITFFTGRGGLQLEVGRVGMREQLWKLDRYYPNIVIQEDKLVLLDLQLKGKIIAAAK